MTTAMFIIGACAGLTIIAFALNRPWGRQVLAKLRGRTEEIMAKNAETAEGAADFYSNAIREKEEQYQQVNQNYIQMTGSVEMTKKEIHDMQKDQMRKTQQMQMAVDNGNDEDAMTFAMSIEALKSNIEVSKSTLATLEANTTQQKEVLDNLADEIKKLKREKNINIHILKSAQDIESSNAILNDVVANNESDRMLEKVREGVNKAQAKAAGSRIAYESSAATQEKRANERAQENSAREMVERMKRERNK